MLLLNQEDDQDTLRAPSMTTRHRCISENRHKDKNKNKASSSLSPLYSQLIQKLCSLHCDSCLVTELDQGMTGALAVYGLPEELLRNDSGRIKVKPDLNDEWVHHPVGGRGTSAGREREQREHEKMTIQQNDFNDADYEILDDDWNSQFISNDGDRDKTDDTQPFVTALNHNGVGCAYDDDDSIAGPIGETSILQPNSDFSNFNASSIGELEKYATTTPFFQDFSSPLLPPPTPRPRPVELSDTDSEDPSLSLSPPPPSQQQHTMVLFSSDWEMEKTQYFNSLACNQQTSDYDTVPVLFESTSTSPFLHALPSVKDEIDISNLDYADALDQNDHQPKHCDLLGLDGPRPRTAHGRQEDHPSFECLVDGLEKTDLRDEPLPPPAPRLGVLSDDFGDEEDEFKSESSAETNYDPDTIYLFDPFDSQQFSSPNSSWNSDSEDNLPATPPPPPPKENRNSSCCSKSYPSPPPSPNPFFPPGLTPRPPKKPKSSPTRITQSLYALSEKSQWKLSVMQFQRSLSTRGMRHPGFPPSPLGPNWEVYHRRGSIKI